MGFFRFRRFAIGGSCLWCVRLELLLCVKFLCVKFSEVALDGVPLLISESLHAPMEVGDLDFGVFGFRIERFRKRLIFLSW